MPCTFYFIKPLINFVSTNLTIWDICLYLGGGIIFIWLVWTAFSGRRVESRDYYTKQEIDQVTWNPRKYIPSIKESKRKVKRLTFLKEKIKKEREVVKESNDLKEEKLRKEDLDYF